MLDPSTAVVDVENFQIQRGTTVIDHRDSMNIKATVVDNFKYFILVRKPFGLEGVPKGCFICGDYEVSGK